MAVLVASLLLASACAAQEQSGSAQFEARFGRAHSLAGARRYAEATDALGELLRDSAPAARARRTEVGLRYARTVREWAMADGGEVARTHYDGLRQQVETIGRVGTKREKATAANELGVVALMARRPQDAVRAYDGIAVDALPEAERFVVHYNRGRAYEEAGQLAAALQAFRGSLAVQPSFRLASEAAFRVLKHRDWTSWSEAHGLATALLDAGRAEQVAPHLPDLVGKWSGNEAAADELFALCARYCREARVQPEAFAKQELPRWRAAAVATWTPAIAVLEQVYTGDLAWIRTDPAGGADRLREQWRIGAGTAAEVSKLARWVGDQYAASGDGLRATARYVAAWLIDRENVDAAVLAVSSSLDGEAHQDDPLLDFVVVELGTGVNRIFLRKGQAYRRGDQAAIRRLHLVLARIFERQQRWGPPRSVETVLYQLEAARRAERRMERAASPGIARRLGRAWVAWAVEQPAAAAEHLQRAGQQYLAAVRGYAEQGAWLDARATAAEAAQRSLADVRAEIERVLAGEPRR